jgi:hypothetical protein
MITMSDTYSVYTVNGKPIHNIFLYEDGIIHAEIKNGWLEHIRFENGSPTSLTQDIISLDVNPVRHIAVDLFRFEHFYCGNSLYIRTAVTPLGEFCTAYEDHISYATYLKIHLPARTKTSYLDAFNIISSRRQERTALGDEIRLLQEQLSEDDIDIPRATILKLLKKYQISPKNKQK